VIIHSRGHFIHHCYYLEPARLGVSDQAFGLTDKIVFCESEDTRAYTATLGKRDSCRLGTYT
jgi:hypothetical protein